MNLAEKSMYMPAMVEATWSGERPRKPACSSLHASSSRRRAARSPNERGSYQIRLQRSPPSAG